MSSKYTGLQLKHIPFIIILCLVMVKMYGKVCLVIIGSLELTSEILNVLLYVDRFWPCPD